MHRIRYASAPLGVSSLSSSLSSEKPARFRAGFSFGNRANGLRHVAQVIELRGNGVLQRLSDRLLRPFAVAAMASYTADSRNNHPAKHTGCPKKARRSIASCFHPSYSELTVFLIILIIISANLPVSGGFTYAMPPYNPYLSYGLSNARSNPLTVLGFPRFRS